MTYLPLKNLGTPSAWKDLEWKGYSELVGPSISLSVNLPQGSALPSPLLCKSEVLGMIWVTAMKSKDKLSLPLQAYCICTL